MAELLSEEMKGVVRAFPGSYMTAVQDGHVPQITRVVGLEVEDSETILAMVQTPISGTFLECLETNPRAALVGVVVTSYLTFQFKGDVIAHWPATEADQATVAEYVAGFCELVAAVGLDPERYGPAFSEGPYTTLRLRVDEVFDQTPRIGAGNRVASREES